MSILEEQFAEWYSTAQVEVTEERYKARRAAVVAVAKSTKTADLELMVRLAHKRPVSEDADAEALERFREPFIERDESFGRGKKQELAVLAAAALAAIITGPARGLTVTAALAVESAVFLRWKSPVFLAEYAGGLLANQGVAVRRSVRETRTQAKAITAPLDNLPAVEGPVDPQNLNSLVAALKSALEETVESIDGSLRQQAQRAKVLDEELDFFWWLQHKTSRRAKKPWNSLTDKAPALLAAIEAAEMTAFAPGPRAAREHLDQAITDAGRDPAKSRAISTIVKEGRSWLREYEFEVPENFATLLPLHSCLKACRELNFKASWTDVVESSIDFKASTKRTESEIAFQAYGECLLLERL